MDCVRVELTPSTAKLDDLFELGAFSDHDAGGFVVAEMIRCIELCVAEKSEKVRPYVERYASWWLALVDHIGWGLRNESDRELLRQHVASEGPWEKVIVIDPRDPAVAFEI
jgi:hypothetical protein